MPTMRNTAPILAVTKYRTELLLAVACAIFFLAADLPAVSQDNYPNRSIRMIVPLPPGATADTLPRIIGEKLTVKWGHPVIIENRPGAAQNLGAEVVANAEPDGYTLLATPQGPLVISQTYYSKLGFDPSAFVPVTVMAALPYVLVASPKLPVASLRDLLAFAKANPDKLNYGSAGTGSSPQLAMEWLKTLADIRLTHIPYKGSAPALTDLLASHVDLMFDNVGNVLSLIKGGKIKALAVGSKTRSLDLPDVPAISEVYPEFDATAWFAIVAPPKTSPEIVAKLSQAIVEVLRMPDVVGRLRELSANAVGNTPAEMTAFLKEETERWRRVIRAAGVQPE